MVEQTTDNRQTLVRLHLELPIGDNTMKKWFIILLLLAGCATSGVSKNTYMARAREYDKGQFGNERTPAYQNCYTGFMAYLMSECRKYVNDDGATVRYWECADKALDQMEECTNKPS